MGLEAHHDDFKLANSAGVAECGSLCKIEVDSDLMVWFKEIFETSYNYILNWWEKLIFNGDNHYEANGYKLYLDLLIISH